MGDLDELDRLHAAATAGEWESVLCFAPDDNDEVRMIEGPVTRGPAGKFIQIISRISPRADASAIVALHNAWPEVSARLRAAKAVLRALVACDDAINRGDEPPLSRSELAIAARAALGEP